MYFDRSALDSITESSLQNLLKFQIPEKKSIEYKSELPSNSDKDKREFLADVSSFANAEGGNLLYGVKEEDGIAIEITGVNVDSVDDQKAWFENLMRTSIEPRLTSYCIQYCKLRNGNVVFIFYIPPSFNPPHVVQIEKHWRFYSRNSVGKYPLDVGELRSIFEASLDIKEKIRNFRIDRISRIKNQELLIPFPPGPKFVHHLIPLSSFYNNSPINFAEFEYGQTRANLFCGSSKIYNYDGLLISNSYNESPADFQLQIFRNGVIELLTSGKCDAVHKTIDNNFFEYHSIYWINKCIPLLKFFGFEAPIILYLTVLDIKGYQLTFEINPIDSRRNRKIERNDLILNDVLIENLDLHALPTTMKPLFDHIWNACGFPRSLNFEDDGKWANWIKYHNKFL